MTYGHFSPDGLEYVITTPRTPRPWANHLTNGTYCALTSQTGGGYSFAQSSGYHRITRAHPANMTIEDRPGRYVYVRDLDTGRYWSLNWQPVQAPFESWEARHGLGYTVIRSKNDGIEGEIRFFVPLDDTLEVWRVRLVNTGRTPRRLVIFPYVEWALGSYDFDLLETSFAKLFKTIDHREGTLLAGMRLWSVGHGPAKPHLSWDRLAFMACGHPVTGFEGLREEFLGMYGSLAAPKAVVTGRCSNSLGQGQDIVGVLQVPIELDPGEEKAFTVCVGVAKEAGEALRLAGKYRDLAVVDGEFKRLRGFWRDYLDKVWVETPDPELDLSVNVWNKYQCWVTFNWSRMVSYYIGGGSIMGFRDSSQDLLGVLPINSDWARERVLTMWRHQFEDGGTLHNWDPITDLGPRTGHSDDALWPVLATIAYIRETGDLAFLDEPVPYYDGGIAPVGEHICKSLDFTLGRVSERGIPLMGEADWNDALDQVGIEGKGESVMTAAFLCWMLRDAADLFDRQGGKEKAERYRRGYADISRVVNDLCWDGAWYIRATTDGGDVLGSAANRHGQIYLNAQTWSVISGIARGERAGECLDSARERLETEYGPCLFLPAYEEIDGRIGIMTMFAPGVKENGTIFMHPVAWAIIAEALLKRERAYEVWKKTSFLTRGRAPDLYKAEPYVYAEYIYGPDSPFFGRGEFTWTTGTAAWMFRACLDWILGVRPEVDGLLIDPVIPAAWDGFRVRRWFRGAIYDVEVVNPDHVTSGVRSVRVDGRPLPGDGKIVPAFADGKAHRVEVVMGEREPLGVTGSERSAFGRYLSH